MVAVYTHDSVTLIKKFYFPSSLIMDFVFTTIYDFLSLGNVFLLLFLVFLLHYLMVLYEFRNMPPGPRLMTVPLVGNIFSLDFKAEKLTSAFDR